MHEPNETTKRPAFPPINPHAVVAYSNACDASLLDIHGDSDDVHRDNAYIALLAFSAIAVLFELTALTVLGRSSAVRFGSMRKSLVTLTVIEMWLNTSIFVHKAWEEFATMRHETFSEFCFSFFLFSILNSAICSRNWVVTLIALARCEAITRPVASRVSTHIFSPKRQLMYTATLIICGFVLSTLRLVFRQMLVCTNLNNAVVQVEANRTWVQDVSEKVFFAYQSAIPITIVTISTLFMIVILLRHRMPFEKKGSIRQAQCRDERSCVVSSLHEVRQAQRLPNQIRATRFILLIATVFIVCEAPVFFAVVFVEAIPRNAVIGIFKYLRFLIVADSFANFVIYLLTIKPFRLELVRLLSCHTKSNSMNPAERVNIGRSVANKEPRVSRTSITRTSAIS
ncbi:unnamed protein product [Mesocestoides corti]|uniref:G_PROTEIN_RECEP_F1_2 domain-containing protein n=1 Tax=Mesocestoides corti TaxID=53468 RepID=A0A0R3UKE8_MESCO|nr:unnamed protein product [Mesocestoides corti]